ncbi:type II toxin-antitoxin system VapC family toxin [Nocardioides sp.]|uniref:type II toxin-antitoxin system VapC family toxin n=1 Tax=Nocardioides sp. TaxID=35761 RepID=UPI002622318C|nr:type II toxin-antitoxin system VapC family toxin [Nocardioides sp.]
MLVVDASAIVDLLVGRQQVSDLLRSHLADAVALCPELMDVEVTQALRRLHRSGHLSREGAERALGQLGRLPVERIPHHALLPRVWELRDTLSAYDATYVALAETAGAALLTGDQRLSEAPGLRCTVELVA